MDKQFKALMVREKDGLFNASVEQVPFAEMRQNEVLIKVNYSSVNYKDALSASGNRGVTRRFPHIPGIDAVGRVASSASDRFKEGDPVLITGYDLGMNTWGGFGEYISVPAAWIVPLPASLSPFEAMSLGTAGLTAGLSVFNLIEAGIDKDSGQIAVSGATGGVGSIAVAILSKLGYEVVAISGKNDEGFLTDILGAAASVPREAFVEKYNAKAMSSAEFAAGIDTVGGDVLSGILKSLKYNGVVTCCGNVASAQISTSIFPFILRGVKLIGIDSVEQPINFKEKIWNLLADEWKPTRLKDMTKEISLEQLADVLKTISEGKAKGRFVVNHRL
ncbi:YhdH/YhfP family quinone oxidoreductase [Olivibacter sp. XZL3]|uniref:YhdH/YhfP family quinone oxidoreductase n=1 Tax=Olivibacter sp. XZL3 TaxID=1735116 RepID=UPI001065E0C9|nr:YhdH/YhfP family quinone oxidoreductase [Olivibacter sp. XZL3]